MKNNFQYLKFPLVLGTKGKITSPVPARRPSDFVRFTYREEKFGFDPIDGKMWKEPIQYGFAMEHTSKYWNVFHDQGFRHAVTGHFNNSGVYTGGTKYLVNHRLVGRVKRALEAAGAKVSVENKYTFVVR